jgi:hypothetical protein
MQVCMYYILTHIHTHTHRDWWNTYSNGSYVTGIRNQYLPHWCGSCLAQTVTIGNQIIVFSSLLLCYVCLAILARIWNSETV